MLSSRRGISQIVACLLAWTAAVSGQNAPCAACIAVVVDHDNPAAFPPALAGFDVFVRLAPGADGSRLEALRTIRERGGRPGVILRIDESGSTVEAVAFDVKSRLTRLRAQLPPDVSIGLQSSPSLLTELLARDAGSYADFVASTERPEGAARWWAIQGTLTAASASHVPADGAERSLWLAPDDPVAFAEALAAVARALGEEVEVRAPRPLRVEEIIARHQAAAARQAARIRTRISAGTMTLAFEAPAFPAPLTITAATTIFADGAQTDLEQQNIRVNGLEVGSGIPRLPLLEPERVAAPPLVIELTDNYRYELLGLDTIDGTLCYVVSFAPLTGEQSAFRGRAWISGEDFGLVRIAAAQTRLRGPIVSSEQTDEFARTDAGLWLLRESRVNQVYEGAAHRTPIERVLSIGRHEINPSDFEARRRAAYASPHVMLRETVQGYRYLARADGSATPSDGAGRQIEDAAQRVRTIVAGAIVDPNISHPLPFAGVSYVDFNLFDTGTQLNAFFGGTFGQLAFSAPSLGGSRWQLAGRAFGIATSFNDRAFVDGREQYDRNIRQRPLHGSVWLMRPLSARLSFRAGYELDFVGYSASETTATDFIVPAAQVVHALRLGLELHRTGWNASVWWSPAVRSGWRGWGPQEATEFDERHRDFQRYGVAIARSAVLTPKLVARVEASWMGGRDLDRFSRYTFGAFDNRLRGYPAALIRYDRGGVLRGAVAWSVAPRLRIDGFADSAFVTDPGFGTGVQQFTGIGAAVETPAPFGTLLAAEWGYGIQGRTADGGRGTHVFRLTAYKVF